MPPLGSSLSKYSSARAVEAQGAINKIEIIQMARDFLTIRDIISSSIGGFFSLPER
jgi:hypothetical protein